MRLCTGSSKGSTQSAYPATKLEIASTVYPRMSNTDNYNI
jgi:hypothetical protein